jgi:dTDP-4-amino-4,6-dideoxygalactose transaminase
MRGGVDVGKRPFIGLDFRLTEIQAAVLLGQLKKLDRILTHLRTNKKRIKELIADLPGLEFREITDPAGECATLLTTLMPTSEIAEKISGELGGRPMSEAGWHVYNNMENILEQRTITPEGCPFTCPYYTDKAPRMTYHKGMLPQTDALLNRAVNLSVGVPDVGLRSSFGVKVTDGLDVVEQRAAEFHRVAEKYLR